MRTCKRCSRPQGEPPRVLNHKQALVLLLCTCHYDEARAVDLLLLQVVGNPIHRGCDSPECRLCKEDLRYVT